MELTTEQSAALSTIRSVVGSKQSRSQIMVLRGYAGTGKTTMLKVVRDAVGEVVVLAPTGKAANRVTEATGIPAQTIHRWLYNHKYDESSDRFDRSLKPAAEIQRASSSLVIIDEASMIDADIWEDIVSAIMMVGHHVLLVGDPFQLPPVAKTETGYFSVLDDDFQSDYVMNLTEIRRQALDNPIIRSSMLLRQGDSYGGLRDLPTVSLEFLAEKAKQVYESGGISICHRNGTRNEINRRIRSLYGHPEKTLVEGEPLLVLRNNEDLEVFNGQSIQYNGELGPRRNLIYNDRFNDNAQVSVYYGQVDLDIESSKKIYICYDQVLATVDQKFHSSIAYHTQKELGLIRKNQSPNNKAYLQAALGYVATCHKFQGSQAPEVLVVVEPSIGVNSHEGRRWLYTAVTRSSDKVWLCHAKSEFNQYNPRRQ
jgi:exodeoxyribonuclease-5